MDNLHRVIDQLRKAFPGETVLSRRGHQDGASFIQSLSDALCSTDPEVQEVAKDRIAAVSWDKEPDAILDIANLAYSEAELARSAGEVLSRLPISAALGPAIKRYVSALASAGQAGVENAIRLCQWDGSLMQYFLESFMFVYVSHERDCSQNGPASIAAGLIANFAWSRPQREMLFDMLSTTIAQVPTAPSSAYEALAAICWDVTKLRTQAEQVFDAALATHVTKSFTEERRPQIAAAVEALASCATRPSSVDAIRSAIRQFEFLCHKSSDVDAVMEYEAAKREYETCPGPGHRRALRDAEKNAFPYKDNVTAMRNALERARAELREQQKNA